MASTHNLVRYLGYKKTYDRLANQFIWPNMTKDVQEYIKTCDSYQHNKESIISASSDCSILTCGEAV